MNSSLECINLFFKILQQVSLVIRVFIEKKENIRTPLLYCFEKCRSDPLFVDRLRHIQLFPIVGY